MKWPQYAPNTVAFWPSFTSCSTEFSMVQARANSQMQEQGAKYSVIFKIFATDKNSPVANIDTNYGGDDWSYFLSEKEVLLMPYFAY